ncbi:MAG TPA: hypothetical protein PK702_09770, partial [Burkholderiaceae bacterium]|nr:hypothetical protein [Burkholderiaceae bacterium]
YLPGAKTDLEGLAAFDTNGDGKLSNLDDQWSKFGLVQDANGNGKQDEGEFNGLDAQQIVSIDLNRQGSPELNNGNVVFGTATVTYADGHTTDAADVMFAGKGIALPTDVQALLAAENAKTAEREAAALIAAQEIAAKEAADKLAAEQLAIQQAKEAAEAAEALAAAQALEAQVQAEAAALAAAQQAALLQAAAEAAAKAEQEAALAAEAEIRRQALLFNQMANTSPADETPIAFVPNNDAVTGHVSDPSGAHLQAANDDQANTLTLVGTH